MVMSPKGRTAKAVLDLGVQAISLDSQNGCGACSNAVQTAANIKGIYATGAAKATVGSKVAAVAASGGLKGAAGAAALKTTAAVGGSKAVLAAGGLSAAKVVGAGLLMAHPLVAAGAAVAGGAWLISKLTRK